MTTNRLGQQLARNDEKYAADKKRESEAAIAAQRAAKEREEATIRGFFESARKSFTEGILAGKSSSQLSIPVGPPVGKFDEELDAPTTDNHHVLKVLKSYGTEYDLQSGCPAAMKKGQPFEADWKAFQEWARQEGLRVYWNHQHVGHDESMDFRLSLGVSRDSSA